jgi:gamma-glutamylcyclotransferase (GGCT)/AIG2-like uncharacterized protein YtfP
MDEEKANLFIYGSLRDRKIFQSVSGLSFTQRPSRVDEKILFAEMALLSNYRRVSPDNVYYYAVADSSSNSKIEGFLIYDVPAWAIAEIDRYEGKRYDRETVRVNTAQGLVKAQAYLASHESMTRHFGDRFHVNLIHELWLRKRIDRYLKKHTRPGERTVDAELERHAERELLATTERDLVIAHYGTDAVSDYYLQHELDRPRPTIKSLFSEPEVSPFIENYLALIIKQVIFNQLEDKILSRYRFELEHMRTSERYFKRSMSILVALQMINANNQAVNQIIQQGLETMPHQKHDLIDYVKYAVGAAKTVFDSRVVRSKFERIRSNFQPGLVPLGAEIELSNLGSATLEPLRSDKKIKDAMFDGFRYFHDFHLNVLTWKLGGYIDDHSGSTDYQRRIGFLELAPGRLNIEGELSRPVTADPWLLNQLIHEIVVFYGIKPHSLHLSFQLRRNQIGKQKVLPLGFVKCLLVLGGGLELKDTGRIWVSRMGYDEITQHGYGEELVFARTSKRKWYLGEDDIADKTPIQAMTHIQQYKFIRLSEHTNYESLILCLKGLQLAYNPAEYLNIEQLRESEKLRSEYEELKKWATEPTKIDIKSISSFLNTVHDGLMSERHYKPTHKLHYIDWALNSIDIQLRLFNKQLEKMS